MNDTNDAAIKSTFELRERAYSSLPMNCAVIDAHTHIYEDYSLGWHQKPDRTTLKSFVETYAKLGVDCAVTAPHPICEGRAEYANKLTAQAIKEYPGKIYGYITVAPNEGMEVTKRDVAEYIKNPGFVGFKFLGGYNGNYLEKEYQYALAAANEVSGVILCHKWGNSPPISDFVYALEHYPKVKIICAHLGGGSPKKTFEAAEYLKKYPNFYLELCGSLYSSLSVEEVVALIGADRLIFGTDAINLDPRYDFGRVAFSPICDADKELIFAKNYLRLTDLSEMGKIVI